VNLRSSLMTPPLPKNISQIQVRFLHLLGFDREEALHLPGEVLIDGLQVVQRLADLVHDRQELVLRALR